MYQSEGIFQCSDETQCVYDKYTGNILPSTSTTCGADAKWDNEDNVECKQPDYDVTIERSTKSGDIWATGYIGSMYKATINTVDIDRFGWKFDDQIREYRVDKSSKVCNPIDTESSDVSFTVNCSASGTSGVAIEFILNTELEETNHKITFYTYKGKTCGYKSELYDLQVQG